MMMGALFLFFLVPCVEAELCYNGGTFDGIKCICDEDLYYGPKCEFLVQESHNGNVTTSITTSALSGETHSFPTHTPSTRATPHPTTPTSSTNTTFTDSPVDTLSPRTSPERTQDFTTTSRMVVSDTTVVSTFTTSSWSGTKSPSSKGNTIMNDPSKNTPSTGTLPLSSCNSRPIVSSRSIPGISSSLMTSKSTTYATKSTSKTANIGTIIAKNTITNNTSQKCHNGGIYDGIKCICNDDLSYGPKCEFILDAIQVPEEPCYNGGIFDGIKCICNEVLFYGSKCEFFMDEIPVIELSVTITVEAQVRVTNKEYNESLEDLSSSYFLEIQDQFKKQMKDVYGTVPGYCDVEILQMRIGSIIVKHKVISQVLIDNNVEMIQYIMEIITEAVEHSLKAIHTEGKCLGPSGPELCFVPLPNLTLIPSFSLKDTCKNIIDPKYADYYYPHIIKDTVHCISRCFNGTQDSMNCFNGVCRVSEIGPHCICNNSDMFWYLESYCQLPIQKGVLGLSLALAVLFVTSIILVVCLIKAKRKKSRNSWSDDADLIK